MSSQLQVAPIAHIGYHKTATTWFQKHVWPLAVSHDFIDRKVTQRAFLNPPGLHFVADEARQMLGLDKRQRPIVLSEENLSGYIHNGGMHGLIGAEMARRLHLVLPDARIVIFIRNQHDIVRASYAQYVSGGGTFGARRYFNTHDYVRGALTRAYKAPAFEFEHFQFDRLIACYDDLFGPERVHVYPYEWLRDRTRLLARLSEDLGVEFASDAAASTKTANRSLGPLGLLILRCVNLFTRQSVVNKSYLIDVPYWQGVRHAVKFMLGHVPGMASRGEILPRSVRERIDAIYAPANRRLLDLRDLPLEELGYPL